VIRALCRFTLTIALACTAYAAPAQAEEIAVPAAAGRPAIDGDLMRPAGRGPFPAVLVLHGCGGMSDRETTWVDTLAKLGYVGLAIDTLTPQGLKGGSRAACFGKSSRNGAQYAIATLAWLRAQTYVAAGRLGMLGSSMGAIESLDVIDPYAGAQAPPAGLHAVVAYYPLCNGRDGNVSVPLAIFDGDADDWTPAPLCAAMVRAAMAAGKSAVLTTYPGATHDFNVPSKIEHTTFGHVLRYDPSASADALARTEAFLARYLSPVAP
jgi:dienelactone hydrolase